MRKRLLKYLRRFLIVVVALGLIGLIGFTWICYWPLEGDVSDLSQLIPEQAEFVLRGSYEEIKASGWIQHNVFEHPLYGPLEEFAEGTGAPGEPSWPQIQRQLEDLNKQINDSIPLGIVDFDIERDVLAGEVTIAGAWCEGSKPPQPPGWQELLLLKRLTWKPRAGLAAALGNGWIRDMALQGPRPPKFEAIEGDIYKVTVPDIPVRSQIERSGCGRGFVMPPDNEWYVTRVRDVVAISNSPAMMKEVARLAEKADNHAEGFRARDWFEIEPESDRVIAAIDTEPLHQYLVRLLESLGDRRKLLNRYLLPRSFERMNGRLDLGDENQLVGEAQVLLRSDVVGDNPELEALYRLPMAPLTEDGLEQFVPAEDTWLSGTVRSRPMYFFSAVLDMLTVNERQLLNDNLRAAADEQGQRYNKVEDVLEELAPRLGDTAWFAVGRLSNVFDKIEYPDWYATEDDPYVPFAFMMKIREGANLQEVDDFLRGKAPLMGLKKDMERRTHAGIPYTRLFLEKTTRDFVHVKPCYYLAQDRFIFSNNEDYFKGVLETIADPELSLARSERYRVAMGKVDARGHLGIYIDLGNALAVPPDSRPGSQPRGILWDIRNQHVTDTVKERERSMAKLKELQDAFQRTRGRRPNEQEMEGLFDDRDAYMASWRQTYPRMIEDYRKQLASLDRLKALALSVGAFEGELNFRLVVGLKDPELE